MQIINVEQAGVDICQEIAPLFDQYRQFYGRQSNVKEAAGFLCNRLKNKESTVFVGRINNTYVGFMQLYPVFSSLSMCSTLILNDLYVVEEFRRKGVARQLLNAAESYAHSVGVSMLSLSTALDNKEAQSLYESMGWKQNSDFLNYEYYL